MSKLINSINLFVNKYGPLLTFLQFIIPLLFIGLFTFATLWFDQNYTRKLEFQEKTRQTDEQLSSNFSDIDKKLTAILANQAVFTEQMKTVNIFLSNQSVRMDKLEERLLFVERNKK